MKIIKYSIIILVTILLAWILPLAYHMVSDQSDNSVFSYYSSVEEAFCTIRMEEESKNIYRRNVNTGRMYSEAEFDSILPILYAQQLISDGRFPDSIHGKSLPIQDINRKTFYFRLNPSDVSTPAIPVYTLFESLSGRVHLEMPGDVFRINGHIEFINPENNQVNIEKSERFMKALEGKDFAFPAKKAFGNPSTRKMYDEGYFVVDARDHVFHLKMVNGKAFVKDIKVPEEISTVHIAIREPKDKSHYGFLLDDQNRIYLITTNDYKLQSIPTPAFNAKSDQVIIMANPLYWMVNVLSSKGKESYALDAITKNVVDSLNLHKEPKEDVVLSYVLPFQIKFLSAYSEYVKPNIEYASIWVLIVNVLFSGVFWYIVRDKQNNNTLIYMVWIGITGFFGFVACLLLKE